MILKFYVGNYGKRKKRLAVIIMNTNGQVYVERNVNHPSVEVALDKAHFYRREYEMGQLSELNLTKYFELAKEI